MPAAEAIVKLLDDPVSLATPAAEKRRSVPLRDCLRCLDLSNRLARWPFQPAQLTSLTSLRLGNNGIKGIQASTFEALTTLTWLELDHNELSHLPAGQQHRSLCQRVMRREELAAPIYTPACLPACIACMRAFPERTHPYGTELGRLDALQGLLLHSNRITHLPVTLGELTSLTLLNLSRNNLTYPDPRALEHSRPEAFPEGWCRGLGALESLDLTCNRLAAVPPGVVWLTCMCRCVYPCMPSPISAFLFRNKR